MDTNETITQLREEERNILSANMPVFQRGVTEAASERELELWKELNAVFQKHNIMPAVKIQIASDNQPTQDKTRPLLVASGIVVTISYRVFGSDLNGKDGSLSSSDVERIGEIRKQINDLSC